MSAETTVRTRKGPAAGWLASAPPSVAVEIAQSHVTVLALAESGREAVIAGYAIEPLPAAHPRYPSALPRCRAGDDAGDRGAAAQGPVMPMEPSKAPSTSPSD